MTIETDYSSTMAFMSLFRAADKFASAYHCRVRAAIATDAKRRDPDRLREVEEIRAREARYLSLYKTLPGNRRERLHALREFAAADGHPLGYDEAIFLISRARKDLFRAQRARIAELKGEGKSEREIARILMIPASTVRRIKNGRVESPVTDDLPVPAPIPFRAPGSDQAVAVS